jgi:beta-xylosidase
VTTCGGCAPGTGRGADATLTTRAIGTYQNPVYGGQPDPMAARASEYYVYGTGERFPIVRSNDLVHWSRAGTAMNRRPDWVPQDGQWNPWAPSVIEHQGACPGTSSGSCWLMYYTGLNRRFNLPDGNNCIGVAVSTSPAGPFTDTGILDTVPASTDSSGRPIGCGDDAGHSNIDAAPFVDPVTGDAYLYLSTGRNASHVFQRTVSVIPLTGDMLHAAGPRQPLFTMTQPWELDVVEAPWMVWHGGTYYLLYSGGRFSDASYAMGYAIASSPTGPFTKSLTNPILAGKEDVVGPGGGSAVIGPHGGDWLIYHGRAVAGGARTLRVDPLVWDDTHDPATVSVRGPTTDPQPLP